MPRVQCRLRYVTEATEEACHKEATDKRIARRFIKEDNQAAMCMALILLVFSVLCNQSKAWEHENMREGGIPCQLVMLLVEQHQAVLPAWHQALAASEQLATL